MVNQVPERFSQEILEKNPDIKFKVFREIDDVVLETFVAELEKKAQDPKEYMDRGGAGFVHNVDQINCIKIIENRHGSKFAHMMNLRNDAITEAMIQYEINKIPGVHSPELTCFVDGEKYKGIVMEKLDAVNLQRCMNGSAEWPNNFDWEKFIDSAYSQTEALHLGGFVHQDLEARNLMIDNKTGLPIIIDFGGTERRNDQDLKKNGEADIKNLDIIYGNLDKIFNK